MFSLRLQCEPNQVDQLVVALWEAGTLGLSETSAGDTTVVIAGFDDAAPHDRLLSQFAPYQPLWTEDSHDWVAETEAAWPARVIGNKLLLAPVWNSEATPEGRTRLVHNPGMASGTGEHPCTQLALAALESCVTPVSTVLDVGTGSGILAAAALILGAPQAVACDLDFDSLTVARENLALNGRQALVVCGSADCICPGWAAIAIANISGTVLLEILPDLMRACARQSTLILTGFRKDELVAFRELFPDAAVSQLDGWVCLQITP